MAQGGVPSLDSSLFAIGAQSGLFAEIGSIALVWFRSRDLKDFVPEASSFQGWGSASCVSPPANVLPELQQIAIVVISGEQ